MRGGASFSGGRLVLRAEGTRSDQRRLNVLIVWMENSRFCARIYDGKGRLISEKTRGVSGGSVGFRGYKGNDGLLKGETRKMTPKSFSIESGVETFHYSIADLRRFVEAAYEGTAGPILISRSAQFHSYRTSGTLDRPGPVKRMKDLHWIHMKPFSLFGPIPTAEQICNPPGITMFIEMQFIIPSK